MSWFKRRKKPPLPEASRLGVRSQTVLAKLGFDLRGYYEDLIDNPLPDEFRDPSTRFQRRSDKKEI